MVLRHRAIRHHDPRLPTQVGWELQGTQRTICHLIYYLVPCMTTLLGVFWLKDVGDDDILPQLSANG